MTKEQLLTRAGGQFFLAAWVVIVAGVMRYWGWVAVGVLVVLHVTDAAYHLWRAMRTPERPRP